MSTKSPKVTLHNTHPAERGVHLTVGKRREFVNLDGTAKPGGTTKVVLEGALAEAALKVKDQLAGINLEVVAA